ncbi:hypothetical protein [Xanthomonas translucens]|uniref:hypothetical protein n=1 Tax=Xanthomonas campestris pv. translucens TaxID=343 RepID=UPI0012D9327D|nr:hypothetical protein [Xanthomonas translucens]
MTHDRPAPAARPFLLPLLRLQRQLLLALLIERLCLLHRLLQWCGLLHHIRRGADTQRA